MKILSMLFLTIFLGQSCNEEANKDMNEAVIEYTANTRGFYQRIIVNNQTVVVIRDRSGKEMPVPIKISDADWKVITDALAGIKVENLPNLKAPSEKRFHDGAAIADLKITYKEKVYQTEPFDHGNPPAEIANLVHKIVSFGKTE